MASARYVGPAPPGQFQVRRIAMKHPALRREIVAACQDMNRRGINQGTSGNISARVAEGSADHALGAAL